MSLSHSPSIVTNGLIFAYDANNSKSWMGEPVTNQFACPAPATPGVDGNVSFAIQGTGTFKRIYSGTYGGYTIKPTDVVYRYDLGTSGCHYHGNSVGIATGQYVCYSVDYYISPDASDYPTNSSLIVLENYSGGGLSGGTGVGGTTVKGIWQRLQGNAGPTTASGTQAMFLYPGGCSSTYMASRGFILMKNPMFEFRSDVKYNPFVNGSRSTSQALYSTTKATQPFGVMYNMTYNSDGTFGFNGTSSNIFAGDLSTLSWTNGISKDYTVEVWFRPTQVSNYRNVFDAYGTGNYGPRLEMNASGNLIWLTGNSGGNYNSYTVVSSGLQANTYHHAAITMNGNNIRTYYNGNVVTDTTATYTNDGDRFTSVRFGRGFSTDAERWFVGNIPVGSIYNRALSAAEIKQNFNALRGRYGV